MHTMPDPETNNAKSRGSAGKRGGPETTNYSVPPRPAAAGATNEVHKIRVTASFKFAWAGAWG